MTEFGGWRVDASIATALFVLSILIALTALRTQARAGQPLDFYQIEFGPAVMIGCGHAYVNPAAAQVPALQAFLRQETETFDCSALPATLPHQDLDSYHRTARYLLWATGVLWRVTGVSWSLVAILAALLYALLTVAAYGVARLGMGKLLSIGLSLVLAGSTLNLSMVRYVRDYAKAPFIVVSLLIMGMIVTRARTRAHLFVLAAAGGAVAGVGFGFRNDLLVVVLPFVLTLLCLAPPLPKPQLPWRLAACAIFIAAFSISAAPVLADYAGGSNTGHVAVLGLTTPFDQELGIDPSVYEYGHQYLDTLANAIVTTFADRNHPRVNGIEYLSPEYDREAFAYVLTVAATCPADLLIRAYAAMATLPGYFLTAYQYAPADNALVQGAYRVKAKVDALAAPLALPAVIISVCLLAAVHVRAAALMMVVITLFLGATAIQFHPRHFFFYEIVTWWAFGFLVSTAFRAVDAWQSGNGGALRGYRWREMARGVSLIAAVGMVLWLALVIARSDQSQNLVHLFSAYERAPRTPIRLTPSRLASGRVLLVADRAQPHPANRQNISFDLMVIQSSARCGSAPVNIRAVYETASSDMDLSQNFALSAGLSDGSIRLFYPVYERTGGYRFAGFETDPGTATCITVETINNAAEFPLLLTARLNERWRQAPLYQRVGVNRSTSAISQ
ncbi:MAG: putative transrane protein [Acidobacteria bacterium]|nr:putative transrane protein [Acidobacteriota bacterium]